MGTSLAFAIPAYNEADGIAGFLEELDVGFRDWEGRVTFVVVDDHSTDGTPEVVERARAGLASEVRVVRAERNRGHGETVVRAYREAIATAPDVTVQVDGDGQFDAGGVRRVVEDLCRSGGDIAIARRRVRVDPWFRRLLTRALRSFLRWRSGLRVGDPNCPLRAYRTVVLESLLAHVPDAAMVPNVHLAILADAVGLATTEVVVEHRERRGVGAQGTMWGRRQRTFLVPKRLVVFSWRALAECRGFLRDMDAREVQVSLAGAAECGPTTFPLPGRPTS